MSWHGKRHFGHSPGRFTVRAAKFSSRGGPRSVRKCFERALASRAATVRERFSSVPRARFLTGAARKGLSKHFVSPMAPGRALMLRWAATCAVLTAAVVTGCNRSGGLGRPGDHPSQSPGASASAGARAARSDDPIGPVEVLSINDDSITVEEVVGPVRAELAAQAGAMSPAAYRDLSVRRLRDRIRGMARDLLLYQEASRRLSEQETEFLDKFTDQRIREIIQQEHNGRQVRWEQALATKGLTAQEARERIRRELTIVRHLQQTINPRVQEPTRRDLMRYFETHRAEMAEPERREMYLLEVPKGDDRDAAWATAEQAAAELEAGADFGAVVAKYSKDINADRGGHWGMVDPTSVRGRWTEAAEVLATLAPGETSGVVEGGESFFIVRLGAIEPARTPEFADVQMRLAKAYHDQQFNALVDELVLRLQDEAIIRPANLNLFLEAAVDAALGRPAQPAPP